MIGDPTDIKESWFDGLQAQILHGQGSSMPSRGRAAAKSESGAPFSEQRIDTSCNTGAELGRPDRRLPPDRDKGEADSLVSFCGEA